MNPQTTTIDPQREQDTQRILELYGRLPDEDKRRFNTFISLLVEATGTPASEKLVRFMHITREGRDEFRAALEVMIAALSGSDLAWEMIDAEIAEAEA